MSIPAKFRRVIEAGDPAWSVDQPMTAKILFGPHLKATLQVMTVAAFEDKIARILAMPDNNPNKPMLRKLFMGFSEDLAIDKDGRVVMPLRFREKLGVVEGDLAFMGLGEFFQIWQAESFADDVDAPLDAWLQDQPADFDPMSLAV